MIKISKKLINYLVVLIILLSIIAIYYNRIQYGITLGYMYLVNTKVINVNNISVKLPYSYVRNISNDDLSFSKYPSGDGTVYVKSNFEMDSDGFRNSYVRLLSKSNMKLYKEENVSIDNNSAYSLYFKQNESSDVTDIYILIPTKKVMINYYGNSNSWNDYFSVIKTIKFQK